MISIIMPAYNAEKYIGHAIESVLAQTYADWELIVIDDASFDGTAALIARYQAQDPRVRYIRNPHNLGVAESRNRGVAEAKGEWVALLDSDDAWREDKLQKVWQFVSRGIYSDIGFIFTGSAFMDADGSPIDAYLSAPEKIGFGELCKQNLISCSSVVILKKYLLKYPFPHDPAIHEDFAVWLSVLRDGTRAYGIDEPLLIYRVSPDSRSGNKRKAARMTLNTYKYVGIPLPKRVESFVSYAMRGLRKYAVLGFSRKAKAEE